MNRNLRFCRAGEEQGVYAWVSANYALGTLQSEPQETTGIVELGGTSLQVYFHLPTTTGFILSF